MYVVNYVLISIYNETCNCFRENQIINLKKNYPDSLHHCGIMSV